MKFRIFGTLFILIVLGSLFVLSEQDGNGQPVPTGNSQQTNSDDSALKGLKIN